MILERDEKYKLKIGKTLISTTSGYGDFGGRKYLMNYEEDEDNEYENEK